MVNTINNNIKIEPTYVTFEQAKLLKEKDFDLLVNAYFSDNGREEHLQDKYKANYNCRVSVGLTHSKPEQWQVVEWLRVKHKIDVMIGRTLNKKHTYHYSIFTDDVYTSQEFETPQEAYSSAFDYILTNLI